VVCSDLGVVVDPQGMSTTMDKADLFAEIVGATVETDDLPEFWD